MNGKNRTAVIVAGDLELLESLVQQAGYDVVGAAENGVSCEQMLSFVHPDVIVVENELIGQPGWQLVPRFVELSPTSKVVLLVADGWTSDEVGAFAVVPRSNAVALVEILGDLDTWIAAHLAQGTVESDRRTGRDRRVSQDWSKVGWERRDQPRRTASEDAGADSSSATGSRG